MKHSEEHLEAELTAWLPEAAELLGTMPLLQSQEHSMWKSHVVADCLRHHWIKWPVVKLLKARLRKSDDTSTSNYEQCTQ